MMSGPKKTLLPNQQVVGNFVTFLLELTPDLVKQLEVVADTDKQIEERSLKMQAAQLAANSEREAAVSAQASEQSLQEELQQAAAAATQNNYYNSADASGELASLGI